MTLICVLPSFVTSLQFSFTLAESSQIISYFPFFLVGVEAARLGEKFGFAFLEILSVSPPITAFDSVSPLVFMPERAKILLCSLPFPIMRGEVAPYTDYKLKRQSLCGDPNQGGFGESSRSQGSRNHAMQQSWSLPSFLLEEHVWSLYPLGDIYIQVPLLGPQCPRKEDKLAFSC